LQPLEGRDFMKHRGRLPEILRRAETGPIIEEKEFEAQLIRSTVKRLVKDYGIDFDGNSIVPCDDDMADRLFEAGMEFAVEVGMFCQDTSRRITWSREEYEQGIHYCLSEAVIGEGYDAVTLKARVPEDDTPVVVSGGAVGVTVPDELFIPMMLSYAQEPVIDLLEPASILSVHGMPIKAGSPWEILGGWKEADLAKQVVRMVGRPGMGIACVTISSTAAGQISPSYGAFSPSDWHHCSVISEFKTNYELLSKVAHTTRIGGNIEAYLNVIYGGFFGGPEGMAIGLAAGPIILNQNYMGTTLSVSSAHPILHCGTTTAQIWAQSIAFQALSRNTNLILASMNKPASGPGTKSILYENSALTIANVASGLSVVESSMSASGVNHKHASGLDSKICGEVARAALGMQRGQANEIVSKLASLYEPVLEEKPIGKPFDQVYDVEKISPTAEWQGIYDEVKNELVGMGLGLK
jgi:methylamine---corrinoid protein Co-methyltransferase